MIYGPRISNTLQIKQGLMIYLPLCSSSTHNPAHSPRWLNRPQLPRQPPSAPSTEREGPWRTVRDSPFKKKKERENSEEPNKNRKKKKRWNADFIRLSSMQMCTHICSQWWKVTKYIYLHTIFKYNFDILLLFLSSFFLLLLLLHHIYSTVTVTFQISHTKHTISL